MLEVLQYSIKFKNVDRVTSNELSSKGSNRTLTYRIKKKNLSYTMKSKPLPYNTSQNLHFPLQYPHRTLDVVLSSSCHFAAPSEIMNVRTTFSKQNQTSSFN